MGYAVEDGHGADLEPYKTTWLVLHISGGQTGMLVLVLTFLLSKRVQSHLTMINFCITWIIYSVSYCLLIYTGQSGRNHPHFSVCILQAGLIHGAPGMVVVAGLFVVIHTWSKFYDMDAGWTKKIPRWLKLLLVIAPPYVVFVAFSLLYTLYGLKHRDSLNTKRALYCTMSRLPWERNLVPGFSLVIVVICMLFQGAILYHLASRRREIKRMFPLVKRRPSLSKYCRIVAFTIYCWTSLAVCIVLVRDLHSPVPYLIQASLPLAAFTFFGTQKETFLVWCFWRRAEERLDGCLTTEQTTFAPPPRTFPFTPISPNSGEIPWERVRNKNVEPNASREE